MQLTLRESGYRLFVVPDAVAFHLAKAKSSTGGTRSRQAPIVEILSSLINVWQVTETHHQTIAPFFGGLSKQKMLRRVVFWTAVLEAKRWGRERFEAFNWLVGVTRAYLE